MSHTVDPNHWIIHGVSYDLKDFAKQHPGGEYILNLGKGRDCTEIFESVHALSDKSKIEMIMKKYKIKDKPSESQEESDIFLWEDDGFYSVLSKKVAKRFDGRNYKATWFIYAKLLLLFLGYFYSWKQVVFYGDFFWAAIAGVITEMIGFCLMHGSSHNAFSKKPILNYLGLLWSPWMFWNHWTWLQHHVYGHHSYTGVCKKDPDIHNLDLIFRKHFNSEDRLATKYQHIYIWILLIFMPGQHIGQIILYPILPALTDKIFRTTKMIAAKDTIFFHSLFVMLLSACFHFLLPAYFHSFGRAALLWMVCLGFMGISYFFNVLPNHDTESTLQNHPEPSKKIDWGEQQVSFLFFILQLFFFLIHFFLL